MNRLLPAALSLLIGAPSFAADVPNTSPALLAELLVPGEPPSPSPPPEDPRLKVVRLGIEKREKKYYNYINLANKYFKEGQPEKACRVYKHYIAPMFRKDFPADLTFGTKTPIEELRDKAWYSAYDAKKPYLQPVNMSIKCSRHQNAIMT